MCLETSKFVGNIDEELVCPICLGVIGLNALQVMRKLFLLFTFQ